MYVVTGDDEAATEDSDLRDETTHVFVEEKLAGKRRRAIGATWSRFGLWTKSSREWGGRKRKKKPQTAQVTG